MNAELHETARNLASLHLTMEGDELVIAMAKEMRRHYILGGISALESLVDAIPASALDLPEEQRKLLAAIVKVVDNFTLVLNDKLKK